MVITLTLFGIAALPPKKLSFAFATQLVKKQHPMIVMTTKIPQYQTMVIRDAATDSSGSKNCKLNCANFTLRNSLKNDITISYNFWCKYLEGGYKKRND